MFPDIEPQVPTKRFITNCNYWRFYSRKLGRMVSAYSWLERIYFHLLEFDSSVTYFCEQPIKICERIAGKTLNYIPDVLVLRGGHLVYVEIKPDERLVQFGNRRVPIKWPLIEEWADKYQQNIEFTTDKDMLADRLRIRNLLLIAPFLRATQFFPGSILRRQLMSGIKSTHPRRICDWIEDYAPTRPMETMGGIATLCQQGKIDLSLSSNLVVPQTLVQSYASH